MDVTLPNGRVIRNVPEGTSKDAIMAKAIKNGLATEADFKVAPTIDPNAMVASDKAGASPRPPEQPDTVADSMFNSDLYQFLRGNMEIPAGMSGAALGAMAGAPLGPPGVIAMTVLGGAVGSGGGSLLSDTLEGKDLDFAQAVEEAAWSAGMDVAMLGLGKVTAPMWRAWRASGKKPVDIVADLARNADQAPKAGTAESIAQTQFKLQQGGATLTPYQTGKTSKWGNFKEQVGRVGIASRSTFDQNLELVNKTAQAEFTRIMGGGAGLSAADLGEAVFETISTGKKALGEVYDQSMTPVRAALQSSGRIPTNRLKTAFDNFLAPYQKEIGVTLNKDTQKIISDFTEVLDTVPVGGMKADELLDFEKMLRDKVTELGDFNSKLYNSQASRELSQLSNQIRDAIAIEVAKVDPKIGKQFIDAKSAYRSGIEELLPELNKTMITQGGKESFDVLGKALTNVTNVSKAEKIMLSLNRAYSEARKAGFTDLPFPTVREAKKAVRQSYLAELFKGADSGAFEIENFKNLARRMETPSQMAKMQTVLGEAYAPTKRLLNLMADATASPNSNVGQLALRTKEYGAGTAIATALGAGAGASAAGATMGAAATLPGAVLGAGAILGIPKFWAKVATDPKTANKLLAFDKAKFPTAEAATLAFTNLMSDLANEDTDYRALVQEYGGEMLRNATERKEAQ